MQWNKSKIRETRKILAILCDVKGRYIYDVHTKGGWVDLLFVFADGGGGGIIKLFILGGRHKCMTPKSEINCLLLANKISIAC